MSGQELKQTRSSRMYVQMRTDILNGDLMPSSKLNVRDLSKTYESGLSPVREALNRLASEGLVRHVDNRGFVVSAVGVAQLQDLTQARCWMNEIGIRRSIELGDSAWEELVLVTCHRLSRIERVPYDGSNISDMEWNTAHKAFHQALISGCQSDWLMETCDQLFDSAERYRSLARVGGVSRNDPKDEHHEIMTAAVNRDADLAASLLTKHFEYTAHLVRDVVKDMID